MSVSMTDGWSGGVAVAAPGPDPADAARARGPIPSEEKSGCRVRVLERTALVRLAGPEILLDDDARRVEDRLGRLVRDDGHRHLVLDLAGVRYLPGGSLAALAALAEEVGRRGGWLRLSGVGPPLRDLLEALGLDRTLEACDDEALALGLLVR